MKILCDANVGSTIARALAAAGHDVERSIAIAPDADDLTVLRTAAEQLRVLITCDRNFGALVFLKGETPPPAILYLRFEPQDVADLVPRILPLLETTDINGYMTVIGSVQDRKTPFPQVSKDHA